MRGRFVRGLDDETTTVDPDKAARTNANGDTVGPVIGSYEKDALQDHQHWLKAHSYEAGSGGKFRVDDADAEGSGVYMPYKTAFVFSDDNTNISSETRPTNVSMVYIIKY